MSEDVRRLDYALSADRISISGRRLKSKGYVDFAPSEYAPPGPTCFFGDRDEHVCGWWVK